MWKKGWREQAWSRLDEKWDLVIIGGGITGAGILREASRRGYKTLLLEAHDFASGTSSRSSKLVHGGLRYLKNAQFKVTRQSVHERQNLLLHGEGLVHQLEILFAEYQTDRTPGWIMGLGLAAYGLMAGKWQLEHHNPTKILERFPQLSGEGLRGGHTYYDAQTDDARLTLRVIQEAVATSNGGAVGGSMALNYAPVQGLLREYSGKVCGVIVGDASPEGPGRTKEVQGKLVISATGAWADQMRGFLKLPPRLRPLRGSHLLFPYPRLPLDISVSVFHPRDGRSVFIYPWEGATLVGTTDVDVGHEIPIDPAISQAEAEYLLEFVQVCFPGQALTMEDVISTWSGIRPVVDTGKANPSEESREHAIWMEDGLLTITGGKLTTFRIMARDALRAARGYLPEPPHAEPHSQILDSVEGIERLAERKLPQEDALRLAGRHGAECLKLFDYAQTGDLEHIQGTPYLQAELRCAARAEGVVHLDDLLLRRLRLGLLLPQGAAEMMPLIRAIAQPELGWDDQRWEWEAKAYLALWQRAYGKKQG